MHCTLNELTTHIKGFMVKIANRKSLYNSLLKYMI